MSKLYLWLLEKSRSDKFLVRLGAGALLLVVMLLAYWKYANLKDKATKWEVGETLKEDRKKDDEFNRTMATIDAKEKVVDSAVTQSKAVEAQVKKDLEKRAQGHAEAGKAIDDLKSWEDVDARVRR